MQSIERTEVSQGRYIVAKWDGNTVAGPVRSTSPLTVLSLGGNGRVEIPAGAKLFIPAK